MAPVKKLDDMTVEMYLNYKRAEMTDTEIGRLYDCSLETVDNWKTEHKLKGVSIRNWGTWDKYFPKEVAKLKKKFMFYYKQEWKHEYIAKEMKMSRQQLTVFKERYFPELMRRVKIRLTDEQKAIAKEKGILINTVEKRIASGMDVEAAIRIPPDRPTGTEGFKITLKDVFTDKELAAAKKRGILRCTLYKRIASGWDKETALTKPVRGKKE